MSLQIIFHVFEAYCLAANTCAMQEWIETKVHRKYTAIVFSRKCCSDTVLSSCLFGFQHFLGALTQDDNAIQPIWRVSNSIIFYSTRVIKYVNYFFCSLKTPKTTTYSWLNIEISQTVRDTGWLSYCENVQFGV